MNWTHFDVNKSQQIATAIYILYLHLAWKIVLLSLLLPLLLCLLNKRATTDRQVKKKIQIVFDFGYSRVQPINNQTATNEIKIQSKWMQRSKVKKKLCLLRECGFGDNKTTNVCVCTSFTVSARYMCFNESLAFYFISFGIACNQVCVSIIKSLRLT